MPLYMKLYTTYILLIITILSCNSTGEDPATGALDHGAYEYNAQKSVIENSVVSAGPVGGYFNLTMQIGERSEVKIEVISDITSENGTAEGSYQTSGDQLILHIKTSTTDYFQKGEEIVYDSYQVADNNHSETLETDSVNHTFQGPGLILTEANTDGQDLDDDGDTSEEVIQSHYFTYSAQNN